MLKKKPFTSYTLEADRKKDDITITIRINPATKLWLEPAKRFLSQPKTGTALKQLAEIGAICVLQDTKIASILGVILGNDRRAIRLGVSESEYKIK